MIYATFRMRRPFAHVICIAGWAVAASSAHSQSFPEKPIALYHAYSAGGTSSATLRALGEGAAKKLGKRVIVEDRPGAGGAVAVTALARNAKPDGYTIGQLPQPILRIPHIQPTSFDPLTDLTWIIRIVDYTYGLAIRADSPWKNLHELMAYAKGNPGKVSYATSGVGVTMHLAMETLAATRGVSMLHVPHKTGHEMQTATIGGHVDILASAVSWAQHVESGKLRVLCVLNANRMKRWPDVPTAKDLGYDVVASSSYGIGGPKGMDPKVVRVLHDAFKSALDEPEFMKLMDRLDQVVSYLNTDDYTRWAKEQYGVEKGVVEKFGLKP